MPLQHHHRFQYSPISSRKPYIWPQGQHLAVYIAVNLEHFEFGSGMGAKLAPSSEPDVLNYSWREYGNRVGAFRLLDLLKELKMPVSLLVNSEIYLHCPELPQAYCQQLRAIGKACEVVGHGCSNAERQSDMTQDDEARTIATATRILHEHTGNKPKGWLGPWISESHATPDLLQEAGYTYLLDWCHDDQPTWMVTASGKKILAVPYSQEINDIPAIAVRHESHTAFADMIIDQFDEMLDQASADCPLVLGIALHPYIVGQPFRLRQLRRALQHISKCASNACDCSPGRDGVRDDTHKRVWLTTAGQIAGHVTQLPPGIVPGS